MAKEFRRGKTWHARATHKGKEYRETLETTSRTVAKERLQTWLTKLKASHWGERPRRTFTETRDKFVTDHLPRLKPASQKRYMVSLVNLSSHFAEHYLDEIGSAKLSNFEVARRQEGVTNGTIRRDLACLSSMFHSAEEWEYHEGNPAALFLRKAKARGLREAPPRTRYLRHEEEAAILRYIQRRIDSATSDRDRHGYIMWRAMVAFAIDVGLRKEEQQGLVWTEIDLEKSEVTIPAKRTKSGIERTVPLLERTRELLKTLPRHKNSPYVFWCGDGRRYFDFYQILSRIARKLNLQHLEWHDLRRTCGCRLLQDHKMPIERVSKWLGHSSVQVTERVYAFLDVRHLHESVRQSGTNLGTKNL